jgi:type IV pilus assembly protein PilE
VRRAPPAIAPLTRQARGFTLIEAMIVGALVASIAAIAIPNYREYIIRSNRSVAWQVLVEAAQ